MTPPYPGRTALFLAPPTAESDEHHAEPRRGEEAMRRLRNPFQAADPAGFTGGLAGAER